MYSLWLVKSIFLNLLYFLYIIHHWKDASSAHSSTTGYSRQTSEYTSDNTVSPIPESDQLRLQKQRQQGQEAAPYDNDDVGNNDVIDDDTDGTDDSDPMMSERPMFLHLVCSVHYKSHDEHILKPIAVSSLPTCIGKFLVLDTY